MVVVSLNCFSEVFDNEDFYLKDLKFNVSFYQFIMYWEIGKEKH